MNAHWKKYLPSAALAGLVVIGFIVVDWRHPAQAQRRGGAPGFFGPRYTVVETQGFNLLVTDNEANRLYYYATDKDVPVGAPLKLRASLDLHQVGQKEIKLTPHNLENMRKKPGADKE